MSNVKVSASIHDVTFRELVERKNALSRQLEEIHRLAIVKCVDEAWHDCLTVNWNMIAKRSR
jgi:hypothetical protein